MKFTRTESKEVVKKAVQLLRSRFPDDVLSVEESAGQFYVHVRRNQIVELLTALRDNKETRFNCLMDLAGVDYLNQGMPERFCVVYQLYSFPFNDYFRVKAFIPEEDPTIASVHDLWKSAPWAEREAFDMYGIRFEGNPDLKRILLPPNYVGYPLRKDYPLRGMGERNSFSRYVADEDAKN